jgi:hypothetical protein
MWRNGIYYEPYRTGRVYGWIGRIFQLIRASLPYVKKMLPFIPDLFVSMLIVQEIGRQSDPLFSNILLVIGGAALIWLLERWLFRLIKEGRSSGSFSMNILFVFFIIATLLLHIWAVQAGIAFLFKNSNDALSLSGLGAFLYAIYANIQLLSRKGDPTPS